MTVLVKILIILGIVLFGIICLPFSPILFIGFYIKGVVDYMKKDDKSNIKQFKK